MSGAPGGDDQDGEDQARGMPTPPPANQAQAGAKQAEQENEEEVMVCWFVVHLCPSFVAFPLLAGVHVCLCILCAFAHHFLTRGLLHYFH